MLFRCHIPNISAEQKKNTSEKSLLPMLHRNFMLCNQSAYSCLSSRTLLCFSTFWFRSHPPSAVLSVAATSHLLGILCTFICAIWVTVKRIANGKTTRILNACTLTRPCVHSNYIRITYINDSNFIWASSKLCVTAASAHLRATRDKGREREGARRRDVWVWQNDEWKARVQNCAFITKITVIEQRAAATAQNYYEIKARWSYGRV